MIVKKIDTEKQIRSNLKSGEGDILFSNYVSKADIPNCRLLSEMTIPCNGSIGEHQHIDETEIYIIKSGIATINDNSVKKVVGAGDVIITYNGEFHSIKNIGTEPLTLIAIIITN